MRVSKCVQTVHVSILMGRREYDFVLIHFSPHMIFGYFSFISGQVMFAIHGEKFRNHTLQLPEFRFICFFESIALSFRLYLITSYKQLHSSFLL